MNILTKFLENMEGGSSFAVEPLQENALYKFRVEHKKGSHVSEGFGETLEEAVLSLLINKFFKDLLDEGEYEYESVDLDSVIDEKIQKALKEIKFPEGPNFSPLTPVGPNIIYGPGDFIYGPDTFKVTCQSQEGKSLLNILLKNNFSPTRAGEIVRWIEAKQKEG